MKWTDRGGVWRCGIYAIYRYAREFTVYRWSADPQWLGHAKSLLEAQLLASVDAAAHSQSPMRDAT